jgi:predicted PurR-regulated permease PerM
MTQREAFSGAFLLIFILLLVGLGAIIRPFLPTIVWAIILAQLTYPMYLRLLALLKGKDTVAATILTLGVMVLVVVPSAYIVLLGVQESLEAYKEFTNWIGNGGLRRLGESLSQVPGLGPLSQPLIGRMVISNGEMELSILEGSKWLSTYLMAQAGDLAKNAILLVTNMGILLFTLFFLFRDGRRLYARLYDAIPLEANHKARLCQHLSRTTIAVVRGSLLAALGQGMIAGVTYAMLGVPFPAFLGAMSALLALLPFGGTAFIWGPLVLWLLAGGLVLKAAALLLMGILLIGLMDNVLYYWITGSTARLPVLPLFFVSVGGMAYFGLIGLFIGPILLAVVIAAFKIYEEEYEEYRAGRPLVIPGVPKSQQRKA